ncbi:MAG: hypothetical protein Q8M15_15940 [Bacteroidota bacterium]|nr:hypothetical protein [Bacteroidota bacterium]
MEMISAKQVEGVVDTTSAQNIEGEKTFTAPASFTNPVGGTFAGMKIDGLYLYWLNSYNFLDEEGNLRIGPNPDTLLLTMQRFEMGIWKDNVPLIL